MLLEVEKTSRILWYYLFTYGLSFLIVTISIAIDPFVYTRADYCVWMEQTNVFWSTFITPIIVFIVVSVYCIRLLFCIFSIIISFCPFWFHIYTKYILCNLESYLAMIVKFVLFRTKFIQKYNMENGTFEIVDPPYKMFGLKTKLIR